MIFLRDLRGEDLEFYERFFEDIEKNELSAEDRFVCVQYLCGISLKTFPQRIIHKLFHIAAENIFCNYMNKKTWLKYCHALQNGRIISLEMEKLPMLKFLILCDVHRDYVSQINSK